MATARSLGLRVFLVVGGVVAASCGGTPGDTTGPLSGDGPFLTAARGNVRTVVVTSTAALPQAQLAAACTVRSYLFNTTSPSALSMVGAPAGECVLYAATPGLALESQNWICAGAIAVAYASRQEQIGVCRDPGA